MPPRLQKPPDWTFASSPIIAQLCMVRPSISHPPPNPPPTGPPAPPLPPDKKIPSPKSPAPEFFPDATPPRSHLVTPQRAAPPLPSAAPGPPPPPPRRHKIVWNDSAPLPLLSL